MRLLHTVKPPRHQWAEAPVWAAEPLHCPAHSMSSNARPGTTGGFRGLVPQHPTRPFLPASLWAARPEPKVSCGGRGRQGRRSVLSIMEGQGWSMMQGHGGQASHCCPVAVQSAHDRPRLLRIDPATQLALSGMECRTSRPVVGLEPRAKLTQRMHTHLLRAGGGLLALHRLAFNGALPARQEGKEGGRHELRVGGWLRVHRD